MDWHIKFVCILDQNGKLLVGHGKNIPHNGTSDNDKNTHSNPDNLSDVTNSNVSELLKLFSNIRICIFSTQIISCGSLKIVGYI
jgi:hypothetical protein